MTLRTQLRRMWPVVLVLVAAIAVVAWVAASSLGFAQQRKQERTYVCEQINNRFLTPLRGLLEQAQSASTRNPLPPGLTDDQRAYYQAQRDQAAQQFAGWLDQTAPIDCGHLP